MIAALDCGRAAAETTAIPPIATDILNGLLRVFEIWTGADLPDSKKIAPTGVESINLIKHMAENF